MKKDKNNCYKIQLGENSMTFKIITLGCKVNTYESEVMQEKLIKAGFKKEEDEEAKSDIIIINTCSVTNMADSKSRKIIRHAKRENPNCILVVCGCSAENHQAELKDLNIDILIGNTGKSKIVDLINDYLINKTPYTYFAGTRDLEFEDMQVDEFTSHTRGFIKVQDGCNNFCTYCIIPYMRGNIRSKDLNTALEEAKTLVAHGHQEIVLTGIHTGSYGRGTDHDLTDLINAMSDIEGLKNIRISSIEVTELNEKFMNMLKTNTKVCHHMHIPLQSGSDKILKLMNRKYNKKEFLAKIKEIRTCVPDINITTDVITGFPDETETDFQECLDFVKEVGFTKVHTFPYSERTGTVASKMPNQVPVNIRKERAKRLIELSDTLELAYNTDQIGKTFAVLIEEVGEDTSIGHTSTYLKVIVNEKLEHNKFYNIKITKATKDCVYGVVEA